MIDSTLIFGGVDELSKGGKPTCAKGPWNRAGVQKHVICPNKNIYHPQVAMLAASIFYTNSIKFSVYSTDIILITV